jgi:prepilin-type N-terminal cleavage/methylation domain-containing protein
MKTPQFKKLRSQGFTLIELLVVISIIAILAALAFPTMQNAVMKARFTTTVSNVKQIGLGLRMYAGAHDGQFPLYKDPDTASSLVATSNEALEMLMPRHLGSDKSVCINKTSKWCKAQPATSSDQYKLRAGECDWAYVRGLTETSDSRLPLIATAFAPGGTTYVKDSTKPGGVWKGEMSAVLRVDGSVMSIGDLKDTATGSFVKRPDNPAKNMFEKDTDWLDGENVEVLLPMSVGN